MGWYHGVLELKPTQLSKEKRVFHETVTITLVVQNDVTNVATCS